MFFFFAVLNSYLGWEFCWNITSKSTSFILSAFEAQAKSKKLALMHFFVSSWGMPVLMCTLSLNVKFSGKAFWTTKTKTYTALYLCICTHFYKNTLSTRSQKHIQWTATARQLFSLLVQNNSSGTDEITQWHQENRWLHPSCVIAKTLQPL